MLLKKLSEASDRKIVSFVISCILFVISAVITFTSFGSGIGFPSADDSLAYVLILPLLIIVYVILYGLMFGLGSSCFLGFIRCCSSSIKGIRIASIILSVISGLMLLFNILMLLWTIKII